MSTKVSKTIALGVTAATSASAGAVEYDDSVSPASLRSAEQAREIIRANDPWRISVSDVLAEKGGSPSEKSPVMLLVDLSRDRDLARRYHQNSTAILAQYGISDEEIANTPSKGMLFDFVASEGFYQAATNGDHESLLREMRSSGLLDQLFLEDSETYYRELFAELDIESFDQLVQKAGNESQHYAKPQALISLAAVAVNALAAVNVAVAFTVWVTTVVETATAGTQPIVQSDTDLDIAMAMVHARLANGDWDLKGNELNAAFTIAEYANADPVVGDIMHKIAARELSAILEAAYHQGLINSKDDLERYKVEALNQLH